MRLGGGHRRRAALALGCAAALTAASHAQPQPWTTGPTIDTSPTASGVGGVERPRPAIESSSLGRPVREGARRSTPAADSKAGVTGRGAGDAGPGFTRVGLTLAAIVALALGAGAALRWGARRQPGLRAALGAGGRAPSGVLEVLGRYPVARGTTLVLLKLDRRVLLLSQTAGRSGWTGPGVAAFTTLCEITDADEVASILVKTRDAEGDSMAERFRGLLTRFDRGMDVPDDGIPVVDLTRREPGPVSSLRRRLDSLRRKGGA